MLVSEEEEKMYEKMMNETIEQVEKEEKEAATTASNKDEKVHRIRLRDLSRKIPMGKPVKQDNETASWNHNKGEEAIPTIKVTITTNLQDPESKHLQVIEKEWKNPSDKDKTESQRLLTSHIKPEPTLTSEKRVRFGAEKKIEFVPREDKEDYTKWKMFTELFTTETAAKFYEAVNKHQNIGSGSRESLLNPTNKEHQMAKKLATGKKKRKHKFSETLKLTCGSYSNHNLIATIHSLHKVISDLSGRAESNRIAQHEGREYKITKTIANRWGLENASKETTEERIRSIWAQSQGMWNEEATEQKNHQQTALKIIKI